MSPGRPDIETNEKERIAGPNGHDSSDFIYFGLSDTNPREQRPRS